MKRLVATLVTLAIGVPIMLWAVGNALRSMARFGLPVDRVGTSLDAGALMGTMVTAILITATATASVATVATVLRSRRLLGVIPVSELRRHLLIFGPTGSGKTTIALRAIEMAVRRGISIVVIDWKGEYPQRVKGATIVKKIPNVWDVPGSTPREKALLAVELIREMGRDVVEVTPPSSLLLLKVLVDEYGRGVPRTADIIRVLERHAEIALSERRYAEANMYQALIRRLFVLLIDEERKDGSVEGSPRVVIYDLGGLPSMYLKTLYANYVITSIYRQAMGGAMDNADGAVVVIAEEAQNYVRPRRLDEPPSIGERAVNELRAFGVGVVMVSPDPEQLPRHMPRDVAAVVSTSIHNLPQELAEMAIDPRTGKPRRGVYVFYNDRMYTVRRPRPPRIIELPVEARVEQPTTTMMAVETKAEPQVEEALKGVDAVEALGALRLEEEEEAEEGAEAPEPEAPGEDIEEVVAAREPRGPGDPAPG